TPGPRPSAQDRDDNTNANTAPSPSAAGINSPEHHLLLLCLHFEHLGKLLSHQIPHDWIDPTQPAGALLNRFLAEFEHDSWPGRDHLDPLLETPEERTLVASLLFETTEEHTSELQSRENLVCRLLLEKKKTIIMQ